MLVAADPSETVITVGAGVLVLAGLPEDLRTVLPDLDKAVGSLRPADVEHLLRPATDLLVGDDRVPF